jgi:N-carbamoylputrescine amidase
MCGAYAERPGFGRASSRAARDLSTLSIDSHPRRADTARVQLIAAALAAPFDRDVTSGLARIERALASARERGARLLVLPESALGGYLREPGPEESAPDVPAGIAPDGPEIARLVALAGDVVVCAGYTEAGEGGLYASAVCVSGDGVLGHQRKVHLPPAERFAYTAGDGFAAFDTPVGRLGMLLCYDKLFPEAARALALDGADVICALSAWPVDRMRPARRIRDDVQTRHFDLCDRTRAVENQLFVVSANQTGRWGPLRFLGSAKVVDPGGAVLARSGAREGIAVAEIDLAAVREARLGIDHLADRRPDAYARPLPAAAALGFAH